MERTVKKSSRLTRHLAVAAAAACTVGASAEVIYRTYNAPVGATLDGLYVNVETGVTYDGGSADTAFAGWDLNPYGSASMSFFWSGTANGASAGVRLNTVAGGTTNGTTLSSLPAGFVVGAQLIGGTSGASFGTGSASFTTTAQGKWNYNAATYFGFRFTGSDGQVRYGWGRMQMGATASVRTLVDIAYENTPGVSIAVGDQGGPPPAYDPCAPFNPTVGSGSNNVTMNLDTAGNLNTACGTIYKANYFKFTPSVDGTYTISTCSSGNDTTMAVLTACSNGTSLGCNDNGCGSSSTMTLTLSASTPVFVVVGGSSAGAALPTTMSISVVPPPNPVCVQAIDLAYGDNVFDTATGTGGAQTVQGSANGATTWTINQSSWFRFVPSATGQFKFQTCGANGDTILAIGTTCPGVGSRFETLACSDDAPCPDSTNTNRSFIDATNNGATGTFAGFPLTQDLVAGQTYYVCVGAYSATALISGSLFVDGPQGSACPADLNNNGVVDGADLGLLLGNWGNSGIGDINNDGIVNGADLGTLLGAFGPCV